MVKPSRIQCPTCNTVSHISLLDSGCRHCGGSLTPTTSREEQESDSTEILARAREIAREQGTTSGAWEAARREMDQHAVGLETVSGVPRSKSRRRFAYDDVSEDHRRAHLRALRIVAGVSGLIALFFVVRILSVGPCGVSGTSAERFNLLILLWLLTGAGPWMMFEFAIVNLARKTPDAGERIAAWSLAGVAVVLAALPFVTYAAAEIWHMCAE